MYQEAPTTRLDITDRVRRACQRACQAITPQILRGVLWNFKYRLNLCLKITVHTLNIQLRGWYVITIRQSIFSNLSWPNQPSIPTSLIGLSCLTWPDHFSILPQLAGLIIDLCWLDII